MKKLLFLPLTMLLVSCGGSPVLEISHPVGFASVIAAVTALGTFIGFCRGRMPYIDPFTGAMEFPAKRVIAWYAFKGMFIAGIVGLLVASGLFIN